MAIQVFLGTQASAVTQVQVSAATAAFQVTLEFPATAVAVDIPAAMEQTALRDSVVFQVIQGQMEPMEQVGFLVILE